jgi:hypothetical protein
VLAAFVVAAAASCGPPARKPTAISASASAPASASADLADTRWGQFPSKRFDLTVPLPDGTAWKIDDHRTHWLVAEHPGSSSVLRVRLWHEQEVMTRDRCEQRAREWTRDLPVLADARIVDRHAAPEVPAPGYDTEIVTGIAANKNDRVDGFVTAFGASMKRCVALVFTTSASGPTASGRVGDRLGVAGRILEGVTFHSDLDPAVRVPPPH